MNKILKPTILKRFIFFLVSDIIIIVGSFFISFFLRFGFIFPKKYLPVSVYWIIGLLLLNLILLFITGLYQINWRFVGLFELIKLIKVWAASTILIYLINLLIRSQWPGYDLPRGIIIINAIISFGMIAVLRIAKRIYIQIVKSGKMGKRILILGANHTAERLVKDMLYSGNNEMYPVAIVDDDPMKIGTTICNIPVIKGFEYIHEIIHTYNIQGVFINLPKASHKQISDFFEVLRQLNVSNIKIVPSVSDYDSSIYKVKDFKQLSIEDLLSRDSVETEYLKIKNYLKDKVILVTGGAGSIGSEIVTQLISFGVKKIIVFDIDETEIFNLEIELEKYKNNIQEIDFIVGDVREISRVEYVFKCYSPQIIFHAAAYKHVPLMERFPDEAIKTNVLGTYNVLEIAKMYDALKFVNISTDKAVNPTSVMGASKRLTEIIGRTYSTDNFKVVSVRFGNVLGSRGSVIPIFLEQIRNGGPLTVTHQEMKRYFMSISEAVALVLQAAYMGQGGEVFVLDMGEPIQILKLAETLIQLNNLTPYKDIEIEFTGIRSGEKLFEDLLNAEEGTDVTCHEKIFIEKNQINLSKRDVKKIIGQMNKYIENSTLLKNILKKTVPYYKKTDEFQN